MTLEFLCAQAIQPGKKIKIPEGATHYIRKSKTHSPKKGREPRINFFNINGNGNSNKRMKEIPTGANYVSFNMQINMYNIGYGNPDFYNKEGNVLKTCKLI